MQFGSAEKTYAPLAATVTSGQTSAALPIAPCSAYRVKRLATSVGTLKWASQDGTASSGYSLTALDPDSGWIPGDGDTTLTIHASGGAVDYEIMRMYRA